ALGYLVSVRGRRLAFSGDQSGANPAFVALSKGADLLVQHHVIPEAAEGLRRLHARPSEIGRNAAAARVKHLVLSHNMSRSLGDLSNGLALIRQSYTGPVTVARDRQCFALR